MFNCYPPKIRLRVNLYRTENIWMSLMGRWWDRFLLLCYFSNCLCTFRNHSFGWFQNHLSDTNCLKNHNILNLADGLYNSFSSSFFTTSFSIILLKNLLLSYLLYNLKPEIYREKIMNKYNSLRNLFYPT